MRSSDFIKKRFLELQDVLIVQPAELSKAKDDRRANAVIGETYGLMHQKANENPVVLAARKEALVIRNLLSKL